MAKQTPEGKVKDKGRSILVKHKAYFFTPVTGGFGASGIFDEAACINGIFVGIEYKKDAKTMPTVLQTINANKCLAAGGVVLLVHAGNLHLLDAVCSALANGATAAEVRATIKIAGPWPDVKIKEVSLT